jgi:hypothetical protein
LASYEQAILKASALDRSSLARIGSPMFEPKYKNAAMSPLQTSAVLPTANLNDRVKALIDAVLSTRVETLTPF